MEDCAKRNEKELKLRYKRREKSFVILTFKIILSRIDLSMIEIKINTLHQISISGRKLS
jgi:hypothetical protein